MRLHLGFLFPIFLSWCAEGVAVNRTIDDTTGDAVTGNRPIYLPSTSGVWEDATCKGCAIQPDRGKAFKGSWTAATYNPGLGSMSIELSFHGTAIYVFFILANFVADGITTETACNFTLDGRPAGSFEHVPSTSIDLEYNALVFSQASLANIDHKLVVSTSGITDRNIFVNFDYAIYSFDDTPTSSPTPTPTPFPTPTPSVRPAPSNFSTQPSPNSHSSSGEPSTSTSKVPGSNPENSNGASGSKVNVGAIAGGVVGGIVALLALILVLICLRRRRRIDQSRLAGFIIDGDEPPMVSNPSNVVSPFDVSSTSTRYRDRPNTHSEFLQSGTIISPYSNPGIPSFYAAANQQNNLTSPSRTNSDVIDPSVVRGLAASEMYTESAYGGIASDSSGSGGGSVAGAPLIHMRPGSTPTDDSRDAMRRARQSALDQQLRAVSREMRDLKTDITRQPSVRAADRTRGTSDETEIAQMREQMRLMQEQIESLRSQQQSEWAQGLSDEPPPGYSEARNAGRAGN